MAWNTEILPMLRAHINDLDSTNYRYTDTELNQFLLLGGAYTKKDLSRFGVDASYTFLFSSGSMTPDPSDDFSVLMVLKAGCVLATSEQTKNAAMYGFKITDDKSTIDGSVAAVKNYCKLYEDALEEHRRGTLSSSNLIKGILSPYATEENQFLYGRKQR